MSDWLTKNGFSNGITYCAVGDTYPIKDELKELGCIYSPVAGWHTSALTEELLKMNCNWYELKAENAVSVNILGNYVWNADAKKEINAYAESIKEPSKSEFVGEIGEKITVKATVQRIGSFETRWGLQHIYSFVSNDNVLVWFTSAVRDISVGDEVQLTGTVKNHDIYKDVKQTSLSRCKIEMI